MALPKVTEKDLAIDKYALDEMLVAQPELYWRVSEQCIHWLAQRDRNKDTLATVQAKVATEYRADCLEGGVKTTEGIVAEHVIQDAEVQEAMLAYQESKTEYERANSLKEAFMQRGYALKELAGLMTSTYGMADSARPPASVSTQEKRRTLSTRLREK